MSPVLVGTELSMYFIHIDIFDVSDSSYYTQLFIYVTTSRQRQNSYTYIQK